MSQSLSALAEGSAASSACFAEVCLISLGNDNAGQLEGGATFSRPTTRIFEVLVVQVSTVFEQFW